MTKLRGLLSYIVVIILAFLLTGCTSPYWDTVPPPEPKTIGLIAGVASGAVIGAIAGVAPMGAAIGGIWGASLGSVIASHQTLVDNLMYNGVQVIRVGDEIKIVLPADRFFYPFSANLNSNYFPILNRLVVLLRCFDKINVKVAAYTDDTQSWRRDLALTRLQAWMIMKYLWDSGIDARILYSVGYGNAFPIANNDTPLGQRMNRRVEITLRKLEFEPLV
jgi:intracellular multiplication protein IcmN